VKEQGSEHHAADQSGSSDHQQSILGVSAAPDLGKAVPALLLCGLLLVSTWWDGAYDLRYWGPLAIFAAGMLLAMVVAGAFPLSRSVPLRVAVASIWGLVAFAALSALWSESPAGAWEGAARGVLFAATFTLAVAAGGRGRGRLGSLLAVGVVAIAALALLRMLFEGSDLFLAGRLNIPLGYRNATAALFAFALWPLLGVAARRGIPSGARAGAFAAAVLMLGLAFLTQSRGVALGVVAGGLVSVAIGPDRVRRLWLAIAALVAVAVASGGLLAPFDAFDAGEAVSDSDIRSAAVTLFVLTGASFLVALLGAVLDNGLRAERLQRMRLREVAIAGLIGLAVLGTVAAAVKVGNPVSFADRKVDEFTDLEADTTGEGGVRLGTVGGQRYDLYRIAWGEFLDQPLLGSGEGSYEFAYYRERRTDRNLNNPHSLPLALLAETGLIGAGLFAAWLIATGLAIARAARRAREGERLWIAGLAAAGATLLAQSIVDWLWLLPGLFALAAIALGAAAAGAEPDPLEEGEGASSWSAGLALAAAGLAVAIVAVGLLFLSDVYLRKARVEAAAGSPQAALDSARTAESLDPLSVEPLYLQASALETQGDRPAARAALREALRQEPESFVTLALLGDLETRAGRPGQARLYYRRSLRLNPLDVGLRELSGEVRGGERGDLGGE
jgi:tetratricopeptide (TPR) repeat protein